MVNKCLGIIPILIALFICLSAGNESKIHWGENVSLDCTDFYDTLPGESDYAAVSNVGKEFMHIYRHDSMFISIHNYFYPSKSKMKTGSCRESLVSHEQGHFDINEIQTRKLRRELSRCILKKDSIYTSVNRIIKKHTEAGSKMQDTYDKETHLGTYPDEQKRWKDSINVMLSQLKAFKDTLVYVKVR
jgi:hypothetical protein